MIQTLRFLLAIVLLTVWHGGIVILAALVGTKQREGGVYDKAQRRWGSGMLRWTGIRVRVIGGEKLDAAAPAVYIANHASFVDIWALLQVLPGTVRFATSWKARSHGSD